MSKLFENKLFEIISAIYPPVDSPFRDEHEIRHLAREMAKNLSPMAEHMKEWFDLAAWYEGAFDKYGNPELLANDIIDKMRKNPTFQLGCYLQEMADDEIESWLSGLEQALAKSAESAS